MLHIPKRLFSFSLFFLVLASPLLAKPVKCFILFEPWAITIDINKFEPYFLANPGTILYGKTIDDINIAILYEKVKPGKKSSQIRNIYGRKEALNNGQRDTIEEIDINDIAIITYKWSAQIPYDDNNIFENHPQEKNENIWSFHGYVVKDDIAFDIFLSADMNKHSKEQILNIIESFNITPSMEQEDFTNLNMTLRVDSNEINKVRLITDFIQKYPDNSEAQVFLGEKYFSNKEYEKAKLAYLRALENHEIHPICRPSTLFLCYTGLGKCYSILKEYKSSEKYLKASYDLSKKIGSPDWIEMVAYNFACLYSETNKIDECLKYLAEAIKLNPRYKKKAIEDSSFDKIKEDDRFKKLVDQ
jgi:tetratricopeptide (TPR) repeat protein